MKKLKKDIPKDIKELVNQSLEKEGKLIDLARTYSSEELLVNYYQNFGYVTIKNFIPIRLINEIQKELIDIFSPFANDKSNIIDSAIIQLDKNDKPKLYELHMKATKAISFKAVNVFLSKIFKKLSGSDSTVLELHSGFLLGIPKDKRLVYDFHQEASYMKGFEELFNTHYPLFRTSTIKNGTMSILPASHTYGTLPFVKKRVSNDSFTNLIPSNIETITSNLPELHCQLDLGDCVIFGKNLIHKSNYNNTNLCRLVGGTTFTQSLSGDYIYRKPDELMSENWN
jgi:ectoine hydroxylase-related dioxygenase (phytanoyl-CoA dioxygenase family)